MPLVSVIVPNYNHAPYLRQRLDSIFNQTFQDFEVIILDDCSTDNSKEIIEEYRNRPQVSHVVYNETNSGSPFKQWAKGFDLAQGEYIWIAESDDWADEYFLEIQVPIMQSNPNLSLSTVNSIWHYPNHEEHSKKYKLNEIVNGIDLLENKLIYNCCIYNASSVLLRRSKLHLIPTDYQKFKSSGDYLFWIHLCEVGNVNFETKELNHYRIHKKNTSTIASNNGVASKENQEILNYLLNSDGIANYIKKLACYVRNTPSKGNCLSNFFQQSFLFSAILTIRLIPIKKIRSLILSRFHLTYFEDFEIIGLIWKILHLPETNLRRRKKNEKKSFTHYQRTSEI